MINSKDLAHNLGRKHHDVQVEVRGIVGTHYKPGQSGLRVLEDGSFDIPEEISSQIGPSKIVWVKPVTP